jgi:hypothetical protein
MRGYFAPAACDALSLSRGRRTWAAIVNGACGEGRARARPAEAQEERRS